MEDIKVFILFVSEETNETTYPYNKIEEGVIMDMEVELLRQAVY